MSNCIKPSCLDRSDEAIRPGKLVVNSLIFLTKSYYFSRLKNKENEQR